MCEETKALLNLLDCYWKLGNEMICKIGTTQFYEAEVQANDLLLQINQYLTKYCESQRVMESFRDMSKIMINIAWIREHNADTAIRLRNKLDCSYDKLYYDIIGFEDFKWTMSNDDFMRYKTAVDRFHLATIYTYGSVTYENKYVIEFRYITLTPKYFMFVCEIQNKVQNYDDETPYNIIRNNIIVPIEQNNFYDFQRESEKRIEKFIYELNER